MKMYNGTVSLDFDPIKHVYRIDGKVVPGVTTVTGVMDKPALVPWAVKMTVEHLSRVLKPGVSYTEPQLSAILADAKNARFRVSGEAINIGSDAHDWIERYIKAKILEYPLPEMPQYPPVLNAVKSFIDWESGSDIKYIASEKRVLSLEHLYSGTADIQAVINGRNVVADLKTSTGIYEEYFVQVAAYAKAIEEEHGIHFDEIVIIRIPKTSGDIVEIASSSDIDRLYEIFLSCLNIWRWKNSGK